MEHTVFRRFSVVTLVSEEVLKIEKSSLDSEIISPPY
jgi:hypothetical protein